MNNGKAIQEIRHFSSTLFRYLSYRAHGEQAIYYIRVVGGTVPTSVHFCQPAPQIMEVLNLDIDYLYVND